MPMPEYRNSAQERGYRVLLALSGKEFHGVAPGEIAKALGVSASNVTRDLRVLQKMGLAEPLADDPRRWRLTPKLVQIAHAFDLQLHKQRRRYEDIAQRFTRDPT